MTTYISILIAFYLMSRKHLFEYIHCSKTFNNILNTSFFFPNFMHSLIIFVFMSSKDDISNRISSSR